LQTTHSKEVQTTPGRNATGTASGAVTSSSRQHALQNADVMGNGIRTHEIKQSVISTSREAKQPKILLLYQISVIGVPRAGHAYLSYSAQFPSVPTSLIPLHILF